MAHMNSEQLDRLREKRPRLVASMPTYRRLLQLAGSLPADQIDRVFRGGHLDLPFERLGPEQQNVVRSIVATVRFDKTYTSPEGLQVVEPYDGGAIQLLGRPRLPSGIDP